MKKISAVLAFVLVFAMTFIPVSATRAISFALEADVQKINVGDKVKVSLTYDPSLSVNCGDVYLTYNSELVKFNNAKAPEIYDEDLDANIPFVINANENYDTNIVKIANSAGDYEYQGTVLTATFTALADGIAEFSVVVDKVKDFNLQGYDEVSASGVSVQIDDVGSSDPEPVFTVDKVVEGNDVKVTVANADKAPEGQIYVATFNGDVLVDCQVQDITNDTLTFSGLAGDLSTAKMFVWDELMIPITYATSAQ